MFAGDAWGADEFAHGAFDDGDYGVASGEPHADSVVLWTRVPASARDVGSSTEVTWEISSSAEFEDSSIVNQGHQSTSQERDWTVKILATALNPSCFYWYRFKTANGWTSVIGRTRTLPDGNAEVDCARFAYVSCQDYALGYYNVYAALLKKNLDLQFIIHLGDAIYAEGREVYQQGAIREDKIGNGAARSLDEYRAKHMLYLSDPNWREIRRLYPIFYVSDDHELWNDFPHLLIGQEQRQRNALQAHGEYTPNNVNIMNTDKRNFDHAYRTFKIGRLASFFALDLRTYRSDIPCDRTNASWGCSEVDNEDRTILGAAQRSWFMGELGAAESKWKFSLSSVMMMPLKISVASWLTRDLIAGILGGESSSYGDLFLSTDSWDGFPIERRNILEFIHRERISGFVSLAGDIHNYYAGRIHLDPFDAASPTVGHEVVTASVTSNGLTELFGYVSTQFIYPFLSEGNPHLDFIDSYYHGCVVMEVTPDNITARRLAVDTVKSTTWNTVALPSTKIQRTPQR